MCSQCGAQTIPPTTRRIVQAVSGPFQTRSDVRRIPGFRWKLTDHVSGIIIGLSLEKSSLTDQHERDPKSDLLLIDILFLIQVEYT